jgi:hypothetical protein
MTPGTPQGAALEKDRHADARPVKGGKFFDGKDRSRHHDPPLMLFSSLYRKSWLCASFFEKIFEKLLTNLCFLYILYIHS